MPIIDAQNPDHLAFIAYGFDDFDNKRRNDPIEDEKLSSTSRFLDSLAHIAIYKPSGQVVAIGADLKDVNDGVQICVAENSDVEPKVTQHLQYIMKSLFDIRKAFRDENHIKKTPTNSPTLRALTSLGLISDDDTRPVPSRLRELELSILRHSFPKIAARIRKGVRYPDFLERANRFLAHCNGTAGLSGEHAYDGPLAPSEDIESMILFVTNLYRSTENLDPTGKELKLFRLSSAALDTLLRKSPQDVDALHQFCKFGGRLDHDAERWLDAKRWLAKISSSRMHFTRVASIVDSSTLSDFFRRPPTVLPLDNPSQPLSFTITRAAFVSILEAAEWAPENEIARDTIIDEVYVLLARGLRRLSKNPDTRSQITVRVRNSSAELSADDEFDVVTSYGAHCECVVLEHLSNAAIRPTTFVGVSKPSCRLCHQYFGTSEGTYQTRGSHGQVARWRCPVGGSPETRLVMKERLLAIIKEKMAIKSKHSRSSSQSTVGSNENDLLDLSELTVDIRKTRNELDGLV